MPLTATDNRPRPLERKRIDEQLHLGIRAIDTLVPIGKGQRVGILPDQAWANPRSCP